MKNKEEFEKTLAALGNVLAAAVNDDGSPVLSGDYDANQMQQIIKDHISMIKACHASLNYVAQAMWNHVDDPTHASNYANYDHKSYANKILGFDKESLIRRAAYAHKNKVIVG